MQAEFSSVERGSRGPAPRFLSGIRCIRIARISPPIVAPWFDGKGASSSNYEQQVELGRQVTNWALTKRASALISHMDAVAREVYMSAGSGVIIDHDQVRILDILHDFFAPEAAGSVYQ